MLRIWFAVVIITSFISLLFFFNRGFAYYDEGYILHGAHRILQGELPYRDFDFIYTPGTIFLLVAAFKLFGESILVGRVLVLLVGVATSLLIYIATFHISENILLSLLSTFVYLAWGPSHINFPWPTLFAFSSGLLATYFLNNSKIFLAGVMVFVTFLFKQNFGVGVLLSSLISISLIGEMRKKRNFLNFLLGFAVGLLIFIFYLYSTNSLVGFIDNFYSYTIKRIILGGAFATGWPSGIKALFYLLPGIISFIALSKTWRSKLMIFPLFTLLFYLLGIRPTTDYPHLVVLIAATGIPLAIVRAGNKYVYHLQIIIVAIIICTGIYTAIFKNYYRWDSPLIKQTYFINHSRGKIFVDRKFSIIIPQITSFIDKNTKKNDYVFIFPYAPMFYFLSERKNPTRFNGLAFDFVRQEQEKEIISDLKIKKVKLIITHDKIENWPYLTISKYILQQYKKRQEFFEFAIWERTPVKTL